MDLNTQLTYVTCIYDDLYGTEFGGRPDPIWRRYYYGLESALKMMAPIVLFAWPKDINKIETHYKNVLGEEMFQKQMKVLPFDLYESPFYDIIKSIKTEDQGYKNDRTYDLMAAKYLFIQKAVQENYFNSSHFFWLDAGLSHCQLFPDKYFDRSVPREQNYTDCVLFTPTVVSASIEKTKDKILLIKHNAIGHWMPIECYITIIGGYFGGPADKINEFCSEIIESFIYQIKTNKTLLLDQQLMSLYALDEKNNDKYNTIEFDSWHHENSGEWAQPGRINKKSFYEIFEEFNGL